MNKARITYRFDESEKHAAGSETNIVIPLAKHQYSISADDRYAESGHEKQGEKGFQLLNGTSEEYKAGHQTAPSFKQQERRIIDVQPLNQFTTDFGAWSSPFDAETERVEQLIRESQENRRITEQGPDMRQEGMDEYEDRPEGRYVEKVGRSERDDRYDRDGRYEDAGHSNYSSGSRSGYVPPVHVSTGRTERHNRTPWLKIMTSVAGAIATGFMIGFLVLSMFGDGKDRLQAGEGGSPAAGNQGAVTPPAANANPGASHAPGGVDPVASNAVVVPVALAAKPYTLLQNGVFGSRQGADTAAADLGKNGLAAYVHPADDKYYVYAGFAITRDDALALSQPLQERQLELFLKGVNVPAVTQIRWSGTQTETVSTYFTQGKKLVDTIGSYAAASLKQKTPPALDETVRQTIRAAHLSWNGAAAPFGEGLTQEQQAVLQKMNTAMNTAVATMEEYGKNPSAAYLWQAQTALMQYMFSEIELLAAIRAE